MKEKTIKSKDRVQHFGEVYTPQNIVKKMCDLVEEENEDAFTVLTKTYLEPACGNGNFLVEILRRKLAICETPLDGIIAIKSIYGVDILPDNIEEANGRLLEMFRQKFGGKHDGICKAILDRNIICGDFLTRLTKDGESIWFLEEGDCEGCRHTDISG